ncbi:MAG: hypothetical protein ACOY3D_02700 [Candidatus Omnitrophota bacterium]
MKIAAAMLGLLLIWSFPLYGGDDLSPPATTLTLKGNVVSVDWVGSLICVRWYDQTNNVFDQMLFKVRRNAQILKGIYNIFLSDIHQQDRVAIEYYDNGLAGLVATRIEVSQ